MTVDRLVDLLQHLEDDDEKEIKANLQSYIEKYSTKLRTRLDGLITSSSLPRQFNRLRKINLVKSNRGVKKFLKKVNRYLENPYDYNWGDILKGKERDVRMLTQLFYMQFTL